MARMPKIAKLARRTLLLICILHTARCVHSAPLEEANVRRVVNQVAIVKPPTEARAAVIGDLIKGNVGIETGIRSRAELLFQDNTLTRLGPETFFSFEPGTRDLMLKQGTMLLQVPKNIGG